ncbi:zinc ribbon domain-containing protein [bacterium 1XD21-13]|nr:zinc ribbon domain-containing protein [bacterium 1XD21-13]
MSEQRQYDFCPKCGAVMRDGICPGCGSRKGGRKRTEPGVKTYAEQKMRQMEQSYQEEKIRRIGKMARMGLIFMGCNGILLAALLIYGLVGKVVSRNLEQRFESEEQEQWSEAPAFGSDTEEGTDNLFDGSLVTGDGYTQGELLLGGRGLYGGRPALPEAYSDYIPAPEDEFYRYLVDAFDYELGYTVNWDSIQLASDTYTVPQVALEDDELAERINLRIREMLTSEDISREQAPLTTFYVTYMSEDILSIVLQIGIFYPPVESDGMEYHFHYNALRTVNLDMHTGEEIPKEEIMPISLGLCARFWGLCAYEHPTDDVLDTFESVEYLAEKLMDSENAIVFYTPVGVELGFNHEDGWITATLNREHSKPFYRYFLNEPDYEPNPEYIPSPKDPYYRRLVNAIPEEYMDQVEFIGNSYEDETGRYYYYYPQLRGSEIPNLEAVNERIREIACPVRDQAYIGASDGVETVSYVTYMDDSLISIVSCMYTYYLNQEGVWENLEWISCVTFDLTTGQEIPKNEIIRPDLELAKRFQALLMEQGGKNPDTYYPLNTSPEDLLKYSLVDMERNLIFYTPVGIEVGYSDIDYCMVTIKENET